ncbi:biotin--[acetyl-CoA-carboxylase] ligase [bacterium endosymbiont of Pedicinus badii]|uniref:biotin--[acetyl-CoA-carboxylase] ligase n=1 Tax=bacterium endosymbiont of Pedicinus badii TaxID=1719126 RepID=UPI0009BAEFE8|nr:biotin--[acetyl-CoA-carboxylase] ligase [bacterium endosymbiont of Pedicinus badii]OQM34131.1 hypothetical protein AOQ89_02190 [bacterium endosymbiont of Pedicinus badii]
MELKKSLFLEIFLFLYKKKFFSVKEFYEFFKVKKSNFYYFYIKIFQEIGIKVFQINKKEYFLSYYANFLNREKILSELDGKITILTITNSTNQYIIDNIEKYKNGDVCIAEYQTNGRGKMGKRWVSPIGKNLNFSIYWKLDRNKKQIYGLDTAISIKIAKILKSIGFKDISVKWPNDLFFKNEKVAGILVEIYNRRKIFHVIIGIGINIQKIPKFIAKSINQEWSYLQKFGMSVDRDALLIKIIKEVRETILEFQKYGFDPYFYN